MLKDHRGKEIIRIGLIRHFPVKYKFRKFSNSVSFNQDMEAYNSAPIRIIETQNNTHNWSICYTSNMKRAERTGKYIFKGKIVRTQLLREVPLQAGLKTKLKLPLFFWATLGRIQWFFNSKNQKETKRMSLHRAKSFLSQYCSHSKNGKNILVITHGFFMMNLKQELYRSGFKGHNFIKVKHGTLYPFEKAR